MTSGGTIVWSVIGGMLVGGFGAAVSQNADYPILKGAVVTGLVNGALTAVLIPKQVGTSGVGALRSEWNL